MSGRSGESLVSGAECVLCGRVTLAGSLCPNCVRGLPPTMFEPLSRSAAPLHEDEVVLLQARRKDLHNPRSLLFPFALAILTVVLIVWGLLEIWPSPEVLAFFASVFALMLLINALYVSSWLRQRRRRITVTNVRTIYEEGFCRRHVTELAHAPDVVAAELTGRTRPGLVISAGGRELTIPGIRSPYRLRRLINALATDSAILAKAAPAAQPARPPSGPPPLPRGGRDQRG